MANDLNSLLSRVGKTDRALASELRRQVSVLARRREFGLNFEKHKPETVELHGRPIRVGDKVRFLAPRGSVDDVRRDTWLVEALKGSGAARAAALRIEGGDEVAERTTEDLVVVADFRDPIYPGLRRTGTVELGGDKPFHVVVNAENYHALEALRFTCQGAVDAIYIDPPYNTRDKDWKYNNDYVDRDDDYKHSKWLSFMERRLKLAKKLLNPANSVLIVTIDEKEVHRLGLLLDQLFPGATRQMITSVVNRKGVPRSREFARVEEYVFFVSLGAGGPDVHTHDMLTNGRPSEGPQKVGWVGLRRRGSEWRRSDRPSSFFPIFVNEANGRIAAVGEPLAIGVARDTVPDRPGKRTVWPLNSKGEESRWQLSPDNLRELLAQGFVKSYLQRSGRGVTLEYLSEGQRGQIEEGSILVTGTDANGAVTVEHAAGKLQQAKTVWNLDSHGATAYGTQLVSALLPGRPFPYPKSLYAVEDALRFFVGDKPDALIVDFFAGSGTTAHAVARLNRQDGGQRRSIVVTNNEVSSDEAAALRRQGHRRGDPEWEAVGICEHITKPRITAALTGQTPERVPLRGEYKFTDIFPMSEGFEENAAFFDLTYEDPNLVGLDLAFAAIAPLMWIRAGACGRCILQRAATFEVADTYAVLFDVDATGPFLAAVEAAAQLCVVFVVTDDEKQFQMVASNLPAGLEAVRLYESYLRTFEINTGGD